MDDILFFEPTQPNDDEDINPFAGRGEEALDPLTFEDGEIDRFIRDNSCVCRSHLNKKPAPQRKWYAFCPDCGLIYAHNYISKADARQAAHNERAAMRQVKPRPEPTTEAEILKSLGY